MQRAIVSLLALLALAGAAVSGDTWGHYANPRFGYGLDIPAGFSPVRESENGDGGTSRSTDGQSELKVWGANLLLDSLSGDIEGRAQIASEEGWEITLKKMTDQWASWSGERDGRIFYSRAIILCHDDEAAYLQIEYPAEQRDDFDAVVRRAVKSFQKTECTNG